MPIVLSKYFDENVRLVAGVCAACYAENDDVKITAVNRAFLRSCRPKLSNLLRFAPKRKSNAWIPPRSPHNLVEESLYRNPWSLLVATIFLNKTSCMAAKPNLDAFLEDFRNPHEVIGRRPSDLEPYFVNIGLPKRRAHQVWRMSHDYVHKEWRHVRELYGIGKYGDDAYRIFVLGDLDVEPTDRFLRVYRDWARMHLKERVPSCNINIR
ncbi:methyl-CpG-binding domain protein 4-like isoform X2 [Photinus pyralis]|nr:methyl-CpG-binding domain protein 4-like isoform X2 [Photinus pyralis]